MKGYPSKCYPQWFTHHHDLQRSSLFDRMAFYIVFKVHWPEIFHPNLYHPPSTSRTQFINTRFTLSHRVGCHIRDHLFQTGKHAIIFKSSYYLIWPRFYNTLAFYPAITNTSFNLYYKVYVICMIISICHDWRWQISRTKKWKVNLSPLFHFGLGSFFKVKPISINPQR